MDKKETQSKDKGNKIKVKSETTEKIDGKESRRENRHRKSISRRKHEERERNKEKRATRNARKGRKTREREWNATGTSNSVKQEKLLENCQEKGDRGYA